MNNTFAALTLVLSLFFSQSYCQEKHIEAPNIFASTAAGMISGSFAGLAITPLITCKNLIQVSNSSVTAFAKITKNPLLVCKGASTLAFDLGISTGFQTGTEAALKKAVPHQPFAQSFLAGMLSAYLLINPLEGIMLIQQIRNCSASEAIKHVIKHHGYRGFARGSGGCAIREGIFVVGYRGLATKCNSAMTPHIQNESARNLAAGILSGIITGVISHPFDTIKTLQQNGLAYKKHEKPPFALCMVKPRQLIHGLAFRMSAIMTAVTLLSTITPYFENKLSL